MSQIPTLCVLLILKKKGTEWMFSVGGADNVLHSCLTSRQRDSRWLLKKRGTMF